MQQQQKQMQQIQTDMCNQFNQLHTTLSNLQAANTAKQTDSSALSKQNSDKVTFAQVAAQVNTNNSGPQKPPYTANAAGQASSSLARGRSKTQSSAKINSENQNVSNLREKRLILLNSNESVLESMKTRDLVNKELQKQLKLSSSELVIAAVTKSQKQQNIVLTATEKYSADFLMKNEKIWSKYFKYTGCKKDTVWYKVVAHGIPTEIFNYAKGLELLKQEIETFNGISITAVNWLSSRENRELKKHGSVVIAFDSEETAQRVLKKRLQIAGIFVRTAVYEAKVTTEQCLKCQKFDHVTSSCKNIAVCRLCAKNHSTRLHVCQICEIIDQACIHTVFKYSNYKENHAANSKECNVMIATLAEKSQSRSSQNLIEISDQTSTQISETASQSTDQILDEFCRKNSSLLSDQTRQNLEQLMEIDEEL